MKMKTKQNTHSRLDQKECVECTYLSNPENVYPPRLCDEHTKPMQKQSNLRKSTQNRKDKKEKWEDEVTFIMENKVVDTLGEVGLTIFDFASLRDAFIDLIKTLLQKQKEDVAREILDMLETRIEVLNKDMNLYKNKMEREFFIVRIRQLEELKNTILSLKYLSSKGEVKKIIRISHCGCICKFSCEIHKGEVK